MKYKHNVDFYELTVNKKEVNTWTPINQIWINKK